MPRILLPILAVPAACAPSPQEAAMHRSDPVPLAASGSADAIPPSDPAVDVVGDRAATAPIPAPVPATGNRAPEVAGKSPVPKSPVPKAAADPSATARGRRTLSTAFVRVGPDGYLTVERFDGRLLVLRDVVMRPTDYCGTPAEGSERRYCGRYAEVAAARPGGGPGADAAPVAGPDRRAPDRR